MTPRLFLIVAGELLLALGAAGYLGFFSEERSPWFWTDAAENAVHTLIGGMAVGVVLVPRLREAAAPYYRRLVVAIGVIALAVAVYGFLQIGVPEPNAFGISNLENPFENLLHLALASWAFLAAVGGVRRDEEAGPPRA